jgi:hypothetical protein
MSYVRSCGLALGALLVIAFTIAGAAAETQQTVKAFAAWQGRGQIYETGPTRATFVGSFAGMVFVETDKGPLDAGFMICPAILDVDLTSGKQEARGRCTITAKDGARAYGEMACKGVHLVGCDGDFSFTGGTERLAGITGGGPVTIRSGLQDYALGAGNIVQESAAGVLVWKELTYKLPDAAPAAQ